MRRATHGLTTLQLMKEFKGERTQWGRAEKCLLRLIRNNHGHRLDSIAPQWVPSFPMFAAKIRAAANRKAEQLGEPPGFFPPSFNIASVIDCNVTGTSRAGAGPAGPGPGQPRADPTGALQQSIYNGWKSMHGGKSQTIDFPNGMTGCLSRMASLRHNDMWVFTQNNTDALLAGVQNYQLPPLPQTQAQFCSYGDSAYPHGTHMRSRHNAPPAHPQKTRLDTEDTVMKSVREYIEWDYGEGDQHFVKTDQAKRLKFLGTENYVQDLYFFRVLMRNCYVALYHNKTSKFFDCPPPSLEAYLSW
jgi:hypothetical protein